MKVFIVDDEPKVCKLIKGLIDWEELQLELMGEAHNGLNALNEIKSQNVDIVIMDIKMPGMNGIELVEEIGKYNPNIACVVVSGYSEFDYVRSAMRLGAVDYILKPINKEELTNVLKRIIEKQKRFGNSEGSRRIRESLIYNILSGEENAKTIKKVNDEYSFEFKEGMFEGFVIKTDCKSDDSLQFLIPMQNRIAGIFDKTFSSLCYDFQLSVVESKIIGICNYSPENHGKFQLNYQSFLEELINLKNELNAPIEFSMGVGSSSSKSEFLAESLLQAQRAVGKRILKKTYEVYLPNDLEPVLNREKLLSDWSNSLDKSLELLDETMAKESVILLKTQAMEENGVKGWEIIELAFEAGERFFALLRNKNVPLGESYDYKKNLEEYLGKIEKSGNVDRIWNSINELVTDLIKLVVNSVQTGPSAPIRLAKQYIEANYMNQLTLEEVGEYIGFNASYLSTVFKKETGTNFLDYLSERRIAKSKELLVNTNDTIAYIAKQVGYSDVKHFNKLFKKFAVLKPNEYRKFYS